MDIKKFDEYEEKQDSRKYEEAISHDAINLTQSELEELKQIIDNKELKLFTRFNAFFLAYIYYRRNKLTKDMDLIVKNNHFLFKDMFLFDFIELMTEIKSASIDKYKALIKNYEKYKEKYKSHVGYKNQYAELICRYYESNLSLRDSVDDLEGIEKLKEAEGYMKDLCENYDKYPKFHLNYGRVLALLKNYDEAENEIIEAISLIEDDTHHNNLVNEYELYYNKIASIKAFDDSREAILECKKKQLEFDKSISNTKIDNFKNVSLVATILAFLLGGIEAFKNVTDPKAIGIIMLEYSGLFISMIGIITLLTSLLNFKFREKLLVNLISIFIILLGLSTFVIVLVI